MCLCGFQVRLWRSPMAQQFIPMSPTQETSPTEVTMEINSSFYMKHFMINLGKLLCSFFLCP